MAENRFIRNLSSNTLQFVLNQFLGLLIFYALSKGLDKGDFGEINWALAVLLTSFGILNFGIDQLMVRKIAAGFDRQSIFSGYLFHVVISGFLFYGCLLLFHWLFSELFSLQGLLIYIGIGKLFLFISTPFKQVATGLERFRELFYMSVVSNVVRGIGLMVLLIMGEMTIPHVLIILIAGDFIELIACILIGRRLLVSPFRINWNKEFQLGLLKEALPQAGVMVFSAIMSRFDWILIGLIVSEIALAEYSFAWKLFEISTLPLLIIAPIMTPMFTRIFTKSGNGNEPGFFLEWQVIIASFVALMLNICWVPVVDFISDGKYGAVNTNIIFILSLSMPVLYFNNYLWTINFAKGKLKMIFRIMAFSFVANVIGCIVLIWIYGKEGAAVANVLGAIVQLIFYYRETPFSLAGRRKYQLLLWPALALITGFLTVKYIGGIVPAISLSFGVFAIVILLTRQLRRADWKTLQSLYK